MSRVSKVRLQVDPAWWTRHEVQAALAERDLCGVYLFLYQRGFSQSRIAALTGQNQSEVSAILTHGRQVTAYDVLVRVADGLSIPRGLMGLAHTTAVGVAADDGSTEDSNVKRRDFMGIAAKITMGATLTTADFAILTAPANAGPVPGRIGAADVLQVREMTTALDEQDLAFGGGSCREAIVGYLNWAVELRKSAMTDEVRRDLDLALSDLENLAAWTSYDMLLHTSAQRFYLRSIHSAKQAGDPARVAWGLVKLGRVHWQAGHYGDALHMIRLAVGPAHEANSRRLAACISQSEALVFGRQGKVQEAETALSRTAEDYSRAEPDPPTWLGQTLDDAELHNVAATVYSDLAVHDLAFARRAIDSAAAAMRASGDAPGRPYLVNRAKLALNAYREGDTEQANGAVGELLAAASQVSSQRLLTTMLQPLAVEAATHDDSTAADLAQRLNTLTTDSAG